ncbi:MAG: bifunctional hydroxymethylpyrimidine kinase/phosphomethylpyrimidine kinase [Hydrogenovibrio sp.]|uniref:bifunctional hydroxymethylpyrimidine kinase/phosphomethylpyrimidine kinase n=1 Tax=Hydrogenovibrio TaxID=28884 RepID=UPI0006864D2F|nr:MULTISPECIES: bifunctional hydroxymethylpyrimidine kinase/phosphomethylpyrimidine kinase [Hydrogenovibrio]MDR9498309.1 bifunctional hydroxymethylpyrimidine kinase/phosphomethylpyrimidine kinase [Hydrogenovibrio sp.]
MSVNTKPSVLTVAGSDSFAGAGIQADLKAIQAQGAHALTVVTAITAQNSKGVQAVHALPAQWVDEQLDALLSDQQVDAIKIGALANPTIVETVAKHLAPYATLPIVLDPVVMSSSGHRLLSQAGEKALIKQLLPLATLITPNQPEAQALSGCAASDNPSPGALAQRLLSLGAGAVLIKGGHNPDPLACCDRLFQRKHPVKTTCSPRVSTSATHGTGCLLSSAIATHLAKGHDLATSVELSHHWLHQCLKQTENMTLTCLNPTGEEPRFPVPVIKPPAD